jgi:uncharacterized membrane protein
MVNLSALWLPVLLAAVFVFIASSIIHAYCLVLSFFTSYLAAHTVAFRAPYRAVFRVAGTAAFMAYGIGTLANGIWKGQPWSVVLKETLDGLIYALVTAGSFGWLWPR